MGYWNGFLQLGCGLVQILDLFGIPFCARQGTDPMGKDAEQYCGSYSLYYGGLAAQLHFLFQEYQTQDDGCQAARTEPTHEEYRGWS